MTDTIVIPAGTRVRVNGDVFKTTESADAPAVPMEQVEPMRNPWNATVACSDPACVDRQEQAIKAWKIDEARKRAEGTDRKPRNVKKLRPVVFRCDADVIDAIGWPMPSCGMCGSVMTIQRKANEADKSEVD